MAITFDGSAGEVSLGNTLYNDFFAGGATAMGWINAVDEGEAGFGRIYDKATTTGASNGWALQLTSGADVRFEAGFSGSAAAWATNAAAITFGTTHHVAVVWDSDLLDPPSIYIDGVSVTVNTVTASVGSYLTDVSEELLIGNFSAGNRTFNGELADMRGYDRELTSDEIQSIYTLQGVDSVQANKQWHLPMRFGGAATGVAFSNVSTFAPASGTSFNVPVVTNVDGQLLFLLITVTEAGSAGAVITETAGDWTEHDQQLLPVAFSRPSAAIYSRPALSEPATYNFTTNLTVGFTAIMVAYDVDNNTVDVVSTFNSADNSSPVSPDVTTSGDALVIRTWSSDDADNNAVEPVGTDLRAFETNGTVGNDVSGGIADHQLAGGPTGTAAWTGTGTEEWGCWTVAFLAALSVGGVADAQDIGPNTTDGIPSGPLVTAMDELRHTKRRRAG